MRERARRLPHAEGARVPRRARSTEPAAPVRRRSSAARRSRQDRRRSRRCSPQVRPLLDRRRDGVHLPRGAGPRDRTSSLVEEDKLAARAQRPREGREHGVDVVLPVDVRRGRRVARRATSRRRSRRSPDAARRATALDIGPRPTERRSPAARRRAQDGRLERPDGHLREGRRSPSGTFAVARALATPPRRARSRSSAAATLGGGASRRAAWPTA